MKLYKVPTDNTSDYLKFLKEGRRKIPDSLEMSSLIPAEVCLQPGNETSLIPTHIVAGPPNPLCSPAWTS